MFIHNAGFEALDLDFQYLAVDTTNLKAAIAAMRAFNFAGYSIGAPNKQAIIPLLDECDDDVIKIGACNTVHNNNGKLKGYNSDWIGALNCINSRIALAGKKAVVLGAGGTSRAIIYGLKRNGAKVTILNRNLEKAQALANNFDCAAGSINDATKFMDYDIIINATPVGSRGLEECDCSLCRFLGLGLKFTATGNNFILAPIFQSFSESKLALDVVFQRNNTEFTLAAQKHNCNVIHGHEMLVEQAAFQFKLFTGSDSPKDTMYTVLKQFLD